MFTKYHHACEDGHVHDSISWSEWLVMIAFGTQLKKKNLIKLFNFLNYKVDGHQYEQAISLSALEKAYRPHVFRLRLAHGDEKKQFARLIQDLETQLFPKHLDQ